MDETLRRIEQLTALALLIQSVELLTVRHAMSGAGVWNWSLLRAEYSALPTPITSLLDKLLGYPQIVMLVIVQLLGAVLLTLSPHPLLNCLLTASALLICVRWRGTFNGGSDYMTLLLLLVVTVARLAPDNPQVQLGCLWYIALQLCASYFIAGVVKVRRPRWRDGSALPALFALPQYRASWLSQKLLRHPILSFALSWTILVFELAFPLALLNQQSSFTFLTVAFLFHLTNAAVLGLNRFLWIWPAAYPALYFCSAL